MVVVGAQWGDEGKGKLVDVLAERADLVVRYQGGANAGHTVVIGDSQFILRQIPSGILQPGVVCIVGNGVVLEPETFCGELDQLAERGIDTAGRIFISDRAHLVLPYHKLLDAAHEKSQNIGTTGRGIGPAYEDKYGRRGIRVTDLRHPECFGAAGRPGGARQSPARDDGQPERASLEAHASLLRAHGAAPASTGRRHRAAWSIAPCARGARCCSRAPRARCSTWTTARIRTSPRPTPPPAGAAVGAGIGPTAIHGVLGVVKAYTTRVGNGPLPTEARARRRASGSASSAASSARSTGRPRRCGWFDATVVRYAARVNGLTALAVTKLDVLDSFDEIPVCTAYRLDGEECERDAGAGRSARPRAAPVRGAAGLAPADRRRAGASPTCRRPPAPTSTASRRCPGCRFDT